MALTDDNVTDMIRSLISEGSAKYWTDAEITLYKTQAMDKVLARWYPWMYETNKKHEDFGIENNTAKYDLPDDCYKVSILEVKSSGERVRYINATEYWKYASFDDCDAAWMYTGGQIEIVPQPSETDTDYYQLWYMPICDAVTEFPECLRPLIIIEAVKLAKFKDNALDPSALELEKDYIEAAKHFFAMSQMGSPEVMGDFHDEESYV